VAVAGDDAHARKRVQTRRRDALGRDETATNQKRRMLEFPPLVVRVSPVPGAAPVVLADAARRRVTKVHAGFGFESTYAIEKVPFAFCFCFVTRVGRQRRASFCFDGSIISHVRALEIITLLLLFFCCNKW
jgi:hypothetical protein